ncbi:MAG: carbohydrate kinase [Oscillospiraceae bacterium]|nr:carbohydrate kinase [Oscillospiraceae bacterium]
MSMKVIAYDVGTTGLKTCMFRISAGESVQYLAGEVEHYQLHVLGNGGVEQQASDWWDAMARSTRRLLENSGTPKEEIQGITFCSQFQTVVMVDKGGAPLRRAMSCMDARADRQFKRCMSTGLKVEGLDIIKVLKYIKITGAVSGSAKDPAWKYLWVRDNEPDVYRNTYKWLDAKEYLTCRATGRMAASRDDASATFLYDVKNRCWSKTLCKMLGINMDHLPELCDSTDQVGTLLPRAAEELGLAEGTPVFSGASDVSLCSVGAGCVELGDVLMYSGTSGWVATTVGKLHLDLGNLIGALVGVDPATYNYIAELETCGKCMEWVKDRIDQMDMDYDQMIEYIKDTPAGSNGVVFSPWMHGNRCPFDDANSRGVFFNLDITSHGSDLMKAVIEGVCMHMRWLLECTEKNFATNPAVRFAGGSAVSPYICQVMADVLGRDVEIIENPRQVGAMGAAALLAVSFGLLKDIKDIKKIIRVQKVYHPRPENTAVYDRILPVFKDLYYNNKKSFAALNAKR